MNIFNYIDKHLIINIGMVLPDCICSEAILDNPREFVSIAIQNGFHISEISWWERVKTKSIPKMGYGGPRDPRQPEDFYFSETDIVKNFPTITTEQDYLQYLDKILYTYPNIALFPAFEIKKCKTKDRLTIKSQDPN